MKGRSVTQKDNLTSECLPMAKMGRIYGKDVGSMVREGFAKESKTFSSLPERWRSCFEVLR